MLVLGWHCYAGGQQSLESGCWWSRGPMLSGESKGVSQVSWPASKLGLVNFTSWNSLLSFQLDMVFLLASCPKLRSMGLWCGCRTAVAFHHWGAVHGFQWWMKQEAYAQLGQSISLQNIWEPSGMKDSGQNRDAVVVTCIDSLLSPGMSWALAHVVTCSASLRASVRGMVAWCSQQDAVIDRTEEPQGWSSAARSGQMGEASHVGWAGDRGFQDICLATELPYISEFIFFFLVEC